MLIKSPNEIVTEAALARSRAIAERFRWAIRPIYVLIDSRTVKHLATCTLLKVGGVRLMVTAAHVIDKHSRKSELLIGGRDNAVQIEARFHSTNVSSGHHRADDHYDFSIAQVADEFASKLGAVEYISEHSISRGRRSQKRYLYACVGFPNSRNKKIDHAAWEAESKLWTYTSPCRLSSEISVPWYRPSDHIFIAFNRKRAWNPITKTKVSPIEPRGASGGAAFCLGDPNDYDRLRPSSSADAPLEGILIEKSAVRTDLVAVNINVVLLAARRAKLLPA